jgi:hypothetical protein
VNGAVPSSAGELLFISASGSKVVASVVGKRKNVEAEN